MRWDVTTTYDEHRITLTIRNLTSMRVRLDVDDAYGGRGTALTLEPGGTCSASWSLGRAQGWYDLTLTSAQDHAFRHQLAGRFEDGRDGVSDPLMGGLVGDSHRRDRGGLSSTARGWILTSGAVAARGGAGVTQASPPVCRGATPHPCPARRLRT